jgi:CTP:molybdopterin cytidylyltransferase MocA
MVQRRLFAIVLAAGSASRFGAAKQLAEFAGLPLAGHAVRAAENVCGANTVVVMGDEWRSVHRAVAPLRGFFVVNDTVHAGMAGSIVAGLRAVANAADAILLTLGDQPLVDARCLRGLIDAWDRSDDRIVCSCHENVLGPPAIFPTRYFAELDALDGDRGARILLDKYADRLVAVPSEFSAVDIDTQEDLLAAQRLISPD